jgi:aqualysin 1
VSRCSFSNFGAVIDIWASGLTIFGADDASNTATQTISGTSMSSPHVAGAVAQMMSCQGKLTPAQVEAELDAKAIPGIMSIPSGENLFLCSDFNENDGVNHCACGGGGDPPDANSCLETSSCGDQAPGGCFCDSACVTFGDCCFDGPC